MNEIARIRSNGYRVVSTFSGAGGSCLGFKMAGYRVVWASEFVKPAADTYRANHKGVLLDTRDIRKVEPVEILRATGLAVGQLDVLEGSPPCASFSIARHRRESGWGKVKNYSETRQRTDDLFFEYARILKGLQPKVFVAENVSGLVKGVAKGYFLEILRTLKLCGYRVRARVLDAQWLGVPQARQRLIFLGVRSDLKLEPVYPLPLPYRYSVRDALPWIIRHEHMGPHHVVRFATANKPAYTVSQMGTFMKKASDFARVEVETRLSPSMAREYDRIGVGTAQKSKRYFNLNRANPRRPSPTLTRVPAAAIVHPFERRYFSIGELKRICAFPDDFVLTGNYRQQWERLGRAVPPLMMRSVARVIATEILDRLAA